MGLFQSKSNIKQTENNKIYSKNIELDFKESESESESLLNENQKKTIFQQKNENQKNENQKKTILPSKNEVSIKIKNKLLFIFLKILTCFIPCFLFNKLKIRSIFLLICLYMFFFILFFFLIFITLTTKNTYVDITKIPTNKILDIIITIIEYPLMFFKNLKNCNNFNINNIAIFFKTILKFMADIKISKEEENITFCTIKYMSFILFLWIILTSFLCYIDSVIGCTFFFKKKRIIYTNDKKPKFLV